MHAAFCGHGTQAWDGCQQFLFHTHHPLHPCRHFPEQRSANYILFPPQTCLLGGTSGLCSFQLEGPSASSNKSNPLISYRTNSIPTFSMSIAQTLYCNSYARIPEDTLALLENSSCVPSIFRGYQSDSSPVLKSGWSSQIKTGLLVQLGSFRSAKRQLAKRIGRGGWNPKHFTR